MNINLISFVTYFRKGDHLKSNEFRHILCHIHWFSHSLRCGALSSQAQATCAQCTHSGFVNIKIDFSFSFVELLWGGQSAQNSCTRYISFYFSFGCCAAQRAAPRTNPYFKISLLICICLKFSFCCHFDTIVFISLEIRNSLLLLLSFYFLHLTLH